LNSGKNRHLNFTIKANFLMFLSIEREATLENSSDIEVKVAQQKSSRAFVKEAQ